MSRSSAYLNKAAAVVRRRKKRKDELEVVVRKVVKEATESPAPSGQAGLVGYVPKQEHEKVCKMLDGANDLIEKLYASGCLEAESEKNVKAYLGLST